MSYLKEVIARTLGCNPKHIKYLGQGGEVIAFSFIDRNESKKVIKIYSNSIKTEEDFENVKESSTKMNNILKGTSKTLKPLLGHEIEIRNKKYYFQIFNYMDSDLIDICNNKNSNLSPYEFFIIALRIIMGVESLHKANIVHCDIKLENILVNLIDKKVKLIDFGFAKKIEPNCFYKPQGTVNYAAPELMMVSYTNGVPGNMLFPADIYSLGIVLYIMFTKSMAITNFSNFRYNPNIAPLPYETPKIREQFFGLLERMINYNPELRPNIKEIKDIMVKIYLNIEKERKKRMVIENVKLKNREKLELGILNGLKFNKEEIEKIELNTLKRVKFLLENNKVNNKLKYNIKKYINEIYCDNIFEIEEGNFKPLKFNESLEFNLIRTSLDNTKLAQNYYYSDKKKELEDKKEFLNELALTINLFDIKKQDEFEKSFLES